LVFLAEPSDRHTMTSLNTLRMFKQGANEEKAEVVRLSRTTRRWCGSRPR
jgi:hypothetical protein